MINCIGFIGTGFIIGILSGLFGVGGGFLLVPLLNIVFSVPYNIAIGSSLLQMVGTSTASSLKHRSYGNIDYKLAGFIVMGSVVGVELGARVLMYLKNLGTITINASTISIMDFWINIIYIILLSLVGASMFLESKKAKKRAPRGGVVDSVFSQKIQSIKIPPIISFPTSKIENISLWNLIFLGFGVGVLSGLLGVGGGFIMSPALIYLIGVPTSVAIGTDLFQIIFVSGYGAITHLLKGNIDFRLVGCILTGSLVGSQLGAILNKKLRGAHIRYYFSLLIFFTAGIILIKFLFGIGYL
ncbi:hypothetical protein ES704_03351 [subsurface metagenome]|jgi:uncharacterized membrane protein YfcA